MGGLTIAHNFIDYLIFFSWKNLNYILLINQDKKQFILLLFSLITIIFLSKIYA